MIRWIGENSCRLTVGETAYCVGHYTTEGNHIKYEYFVGGDGGQYLNEHGLIKEDAILIGQSYDALSLGALAAEFTKD